MADVFNIDLSEEKKINNGNKKVGSYFLSVIEIKHEKIAEKVNATKSETSLVNELAPSEYTDSHECSDSATSSLNLSDAHFSLE